MTYVPATDVKQNFGRYVEEAQHGPVHVQKHGRDSVVIVSARHYAELVKNQRSREAGELDAETVDRLTGARMDTRHDHLDRLMGD